MAKVARKQVVYEVGDVVAVKAGGPPMTVEAYDAEGELVSCVWFSRNPDHQWTGPHRENFNPDLLERAEPDESE